MVMFSWFDSHTIEETSDASIPIEEKPSISVNLEWHFGEIEYYLFGISVC
jgi:hypothetical protein